MVSELPSPHAGPLPAQPQRPRNRGGVSDRKASYLSAAAPADKAIAAMLTSGSATEYQNAEFEDPGILERVRGGLPFAALENLIRVIGAPQKEIAGVVGIPATTLARRRSSGRLTPTESDHVVRVARLAAMASDLMAGDIDAARRWLTTPNRRLADESPLRRASTETGGREVEQLIGQLRHGIFS